MRRAVWSFWSKPFQTLHQRAWLHPKYHLLSWILSVRTAERFFPETALITDDFGAELLVSKLKLRFGHVSRDLNQLADTDPCWWALGKLYAYRSQSEPFVHLDSDVFLWRGLPPHLNGLSAFAQNPERFTFGTGAYRPDVWDNLLDKQGWLPLEWQWYTKRHGNTAACCGIFGGANTAFIQHYANQAVAIIDRNVKQFERLEPLAKLGSNILLEQYFLAACAEFYRQHPDPSIGEVKLAYLFDSERAAAIEADGAGYTHLIAGAKLNHDLCARLEQRVRRDYRSDYDNMIATVLA